MPGTVTEHVTSVHARTASAVGLHTGPQLSAATAESTKASQLNAHLLIEQLTCLIGTLTKTPAARKKLKQAC
jgi:hypothetical protein